MQAMRNYLAASSTLLALGLVAALAFWLVLLPY